MPKIFISYRRADSATNSGRLRENLCEAFGDDQVFIDFDDIPPGSNFPQEIQEGLHSAKVILIVIGEKWISIQDQKTGKRRLDDLKDFVRIEVETALRLQGEKGTLVIPILTGSAQMPGETDLPESMKALPAINGLPLRDGRDYERDLGDIVAAIVPRVSRLPPPPPKPWWEQWWARLQRSKRAHKAAVSLVWFLNIALLLLVAIVPIPPEPISIRLVAWSDSGCAVTAGALNGDLALIPDVEVLTDPNATGYDLGIEGRCDTASQPVTLTLERADSQAVPVVIEPDELKSIVIQPRTLAHAVEIINTLIGYIRGGSYLDVAAGLNVPSVVTLNANEQDKITFLRANSLLYAGCYLDAIEAYEQLPQNAAVLNNLGIAYANQAYQLIGNLSTPNGCPQPPPDQNWRAYRDKAMPIFVQASGMAADAGSKARILLNRGRLAYSFGLPTDLGLIGNVQTDCESAKNQTTNARLQAEGHLCLGITILRPVLELPDQQVNTCDIHQIIKDARQEIEQAAISGVNEAHYWLGAAAFLETRITQSCVTEAERQGAPGKAQKLLCRFIGNAEAQPVLLAAEELLKQDAENKLQQLNLTC